jgi:hypothetical protein
MPKISVKNRGYELFDSLYVALPGVGNPRNLLILLLPESKERCIRVTVDDDACKLMNPWEHQTRNEKDVINQAHSQSGIKLRLSPHFFYPIHE